MSNIETSVFEITNLKELSCDYRLYKVKGLHAESEEFDKNVQLLIDAASSVTSSPCIKIVRDNSILIAQPTKYKEVPKSIQLVRTNVVIEKQENHLHLAFDKLTDETRHLGIRFLQFVLQEGVLSNGDMWRPGAGTPFFSKTPDAEFQRLSQDIDLYRGFACRIVALPSNRLGLSVDTRTKYVSRKPLPAKISRDDFRKNYNGAHIIYEYGKVWYEQILCELDDLNASERIIEKEINGVINKLSLYNLVARQYEGVTKTALFAGLTKDCAVVTYRTKQGSHKHMPAVLCRLTHDTQAVRDGHRFSILPPHKKREMLLYIAKNYLGDISFNGTKVIFSRDMVNVQDQRLKSPTLLFGNKRTLKLDDLPRVEDFGRMKENLVSSEEAGFYFKKLFDKQYIILPSSVNDTFSQRFTADLKETVNNMYRPDKPYAPEILVYDDSGRYSYTEIGKRIMEAVRGRNPSAGYAVAMIPRMQSPRINREDELANYIMVKLRESGVNASVIHSDTPRSCMAQKHTNGNVVWDVSHDSKLRSRYKGYIRNVALNKVLLLNDMWPFILKTPLTADVVVGIDVKEYSAGFTFVTKMADRVRFNVHRSKCKEQLNRLQVKKFVKEFISMHTAITGRPIENILIHRDGMLYPQEMIGIKDAINELKKESKITSGGGGTFLEIRKSSRSPIRMFDIVHNRSVQKEIVRNPFNGTYCVFDNDAYIVTTGYPFRHGGTSNPLHIIWKGGNMPFEAALQDTFSLTHLTWTKIDDCSRVPLTIKFGDIRLRETSGEFDNDAYEMGYDKNGEESQDE